MHIRKKENIKKNNTIENRFNYFPPIIDVEHLNDNGKLLSDDEIKKIIKIFKNDNKLDRITFKFNSPKGKNGEYKKITIISLMKNNEKNNYSFFAIYQGKKRGKLLGEGGSGKVKIMQDLISGQFYALKITQEATKKEINNLIKANMSPGYRVRIKDDQQYYLIGMELAPGKDVDKQFINPYKIFLVDYSNALTLHYVYKRIESLGEIVYSQDVIEPQITNILCLDLENGLPVCKIRLEIPTENKFIIQSIILSNLDENEQEKIIEYVNNFKNGIAVKPLDKGLSTKILTFIKQKTDFIIEKPNLADLAKVCEGMAVAVKNLHEIGLIHKDIKPEQFIVDLPSNTTTLIDLGSAEEMTNKLCSISEGFTFQYMTPEGLLKFAEKKYTTEDAAIDAFEQLKEMDSTFNKFIIDHKITDPTILWKLCDRVKSNKQNITPDMFSLNNLYTLFNNLDHLDNDNSKIQKNDDVYQLFLNHNLKYEDLSQLQKYGRQYEQLKNKLFALRREEQYLIENSPSSDIYTLGISLGHLFGLTKHVNPIDHFDFFSNLDPNIYDINTFAPGNKAADVYAIKTSIEYENDPITSNPEELEKIEILRKFLTSMTAFDPADRPSIEAVIKFMRYFSQQFETSFSPIFPLVILKTTDFARLNEIQQNRLIKKLKKNKIVLLASELEDTTKDIYILKLFFEKNGISVHDVYYTQIKFDEVDLFKILGKDASIIEINNDNNQDIHISKKQVSSFNHKYKSEKISPIKYSRYLKHDRRPTEPKLIQTPSFESFQKRKKSESKTISERNEYTLNSSYQKNLLFKVKKDTINLSLEKGENKQYSLQSNPSQQNIFILENQNEHEVPLNSSNIETIILNPSISLENPPSIVKRHQFNRTSINHRKRPSKFQ